MRVLVVEIRVANHFGCYPKYAKRSTDPTHSSAASAHLKAIATMCRSRRYLTLFGVTFVNGVALGGLLDSSMTLYLNDRYGINSLGAGLVFIAAVSYTQFVRQENLKDCQIVPNFFISPLAGHLTDRSGAKWIGAFGLILAIPFFFLLIIPSPLAVLIVFLAFLGKSLMHHLGNRMLTPTDVGASFGFWLPPIMQDLSSGLETIPGLGFAHVYGAFNGAFSVGAFIGE